ncbi:DNA mismatch repair protein MSH6 [Vairimorpha necatrix]|uniref:DNA mismatch repair protein MSH6 n=1 Tax=Vairimorpha necatrix TaxID=6039 RepID=A0AAX4J9L5_9MICR
MHNLKDFIKKQSEKKKEEFLLSTSEEEMFSSLDSPKKILKSSTEGNINDTIITNNSTIINDTYNRNNNDTSTNNSNNNSTNNRNMESGGRYNFLKDIKDKNGNSPTSPNYDKSSLFISPSDLQTLSPFERQFWSIKKDYFDTVVFFKKGKFYELYENDADIASRLFNFRITDRVNMRMAGFPESSLDDWICKFLEAGYKIARVDQLDNMVSKKMKDDKEKILQRELKEVITQGTVADMNHLKTNDSVCTLVIHENTTNISDDTSFNFDIMLFDASTNKIFCKTFTDDENLNTLKTISTKYTIKEYISKRKYNFLKNFIKAEISTTTSDTNCNISSSSMCYGYLYNYMKYLKREKSLNSCQFINLDSDSSGLSLDSNTIKNMDLISTEHDKTLFKLINYCSTPFGQRKLMNWMMTPFGNYKEIKERQELIKIIGEKDIENIEKNMKELGDLERGFSKIRSGNGKFKDLKEIIKKTEIIIKIYEIIMEIFSDKINDKDKNNDNSINIKDRDGDSGKKRAKIYNETNLKETKHNEFINKIVEIKTGEKYQFINRTKLINFIKDYNLNYKIKDDEIVPGKNNSEEISRLLEDKKNIIKKFDEILEKEKIKLKCKEINYKNVGKEIFQLEVPKNINNKVCDQDSVISKNDTNNYFLVSSTKSCNRFYTTEIRSLISEFQILEEKIFQANGKLFNHAVSYFLKSEDLFFNIINDLSDLDCLISSVKFNLKIQGCVPVESNILNVENMGNPIYKEYIRNNYKESNNILILTGSNMAGKSTFMRSLCLNIILYQMGLNVLASKFECSVFDKLYSRMGASDNLRRGESTFMVELNETCHILKNATNRSLVIMDELGRGTSTKDGECIARAVLKKLEEIKCRVLFSTHYHNLILMKYSHGFMNTMIKGGRVVFLYKLKEGRCEDSNGVYVAKLAGVPEEIIKRAEVYKNKYEI